MGNFRAVVRYGRLHGQREGWDLVGELGRFAAEAPVAELREKLGYRAVWWSSKVVPSAPCFPARKLSANLLKSVAMITPGWPAWGWALASVCAVSLLSFSGVLLALGSNRRKVQPLVFVLVGLAVGAMFGDTFLHLLPESFERSTSSLATSLYCLAGIGIFFVLEKFLLWRHDHADEHTHPIHPVGYLNLVADGLHNLMDGILIGASYLVSVPIGIGTTIAVCFHEIPQEIGDFGILLHAGFTRRRALWLNFMTGTVAIAGTVLALLVGTWLSAFSGAMLPLTAGSFIYIAGSDLVPELHKERQPGQAAIQFIAIGSGIGLMLLLKLWGSG